MAHKLSSACAEMIASYHFSPQGQLQPLHGLELVIKEEVLASLERPGGSHEDVGRKKIALLASHGLLAPDTWKCKRAQVASRQQLMSQCRHNHGTKW